MEKCATNVGRGKAKRRATGKYIPAVVPRQVRCDGRVSPLSAIPHDLQCLLYVADIHQEHSFTKTVDEMEKTKIDGLTSTESAFKSPVSTTIISPFCGTMLGCVSLY